ncbi:MAG: ABC transporter permease [Rhodospirillaceae bacterium]|nr:ABC transporter permease [Rhodospirillaceae bacterium]
MTTARTARPGEVQIAVGGVLVGIMALLALVAVVWTPFDPVDIDVPVRLQGPSLGHWLGTDYLGRDMLSMVMAGGSSSLGTAVSAVLLGALAGVPVGLAAALGGHWTDTLCRGAIDLVFAFPVVLTGLVLLALNGPGSINAVVAIAVFDASVLARVTRNAARGVLAQDYVRAARAIGRGPLGLAWLHVLPNIRGILLIQSTVLLAIGVLAEAGLTYLGVGAQLPQPTWGKMLFDAQVFMQFHPGQAIVPGTAIALSVLGFNLLGDGLRDRLDPRLAGARRRRGRSGGALREDPAVATVITSDLALENGLKGVSERR